MACQTQVVQFGGGDVLFVVQGGDLEAIEQLVACLHSADGSDPRDLRASDLAGSAQSEDPATQQQMIGASRWIRR